ncbi:MAG: efflux RND transporter periplasmic adaptor subunit [Thiotrichaceae bacterium]|nr:efflux RND transporter periplasmic adaptor subunit [Thiotrichaceae bacterium]
MRPTPWIIPLLLLAPVANSAPPLESITATLENVDSEQVVDGIVEAINQATLKAQTSGQVLEVNFDTNDFVKQGSVLVRIKPNEQKAALGQAQAQLGEAKAQLQAAQDEYNRLSKVFAKNAISAAEMDRSTSNVNAARARYNSVQANLSRVGEQSEYTVLRAPYSGIVQQRFIQVGEIATVGQPIMSGFSLEDMRTVASIPQHLLETVRQNKQAKIMLYSGGEPKVFEGKNLVIIPNADPQSHSFKVRVSFPSNVEGIYPGMFTKVIFSTAKQQRLLVPTEAVTYRGEISAVYVQDKDGKIFMRQVRVGDTFGKKLEMLAGVQAGEQIILDPVAAAIRLKEQRSSEGVARHE